MAHFAKLRTPLGALHKYPTTIAQEKRFEGLGWAKACARNLWRLWNDPNFLTSQERMALDILEPFDEWEEFALFGCHYFLLVAATTVNTLGAEFVEGDAILSDNESLNQDIVQSVEIELKYVASPKAQGCRRFGAVLPLRGSNRIQDRVGIFGGMGLHSRMNTYDVYGTQLSDNMHSITRSTSVEPSSRMCHTITDIGEAGALLVGGRTSPDTALADCWLYHKWLDAWERVDDLPCPLYRHAAVNLGHGHVLVAPGKTNSRKVTTDFSVWSRYLGWTKCIQDPGGMPLPSYGATFTVFESSRNLGESRRGLLAGGISEDVLFLEDVWEWEVHDFSSQVSTKRQVAELSNT